MGLMPIETRTSENEKNGQGLNAPYSSVRGGANRYAWFIYLACCVAAGILPAHVAWGQPDPNGRQVRRTPQSRATAPAGLALSADLTRRLWESRISLPDPNEDSDTREDLKNLIAQVRSLKFESNEATPAFSSPDETEAPVVSHRGDRVAGPQPDNTTRPAPAAMPQANPGKTPEPMTLEKLNGLLQDPEHTRHPLEVAELLFLSGHPVEATGFYEKALAQTAHDDPATRTDRAWILFQLGNCLRQTDMARARDMYLKLITEFPNSPWTELAKAHGRLIAWYLAAKPQQLLAPQTE
jgi:hypothetical protein